MEKKDTKSHKGFFGRKTKETNDNSEDFQGTVGKLEKMEIETNPSQQKKGKNLDEWQPWNCARVPRISDPELREWIEESNQDRKSRSKEKILRLLEELLEGRD